jgi:hypothetical protein
MMIDTGRTHTPYGVAYYWIMFMTKLPDGRVVTVNGGDGMGTKYQGMDQASEDFISIDKEFYRLDLFRMISDDNKNKVSEKRFKTAEATNDYKRIFPQNNCDLTFEPVFSNSEQSMVEDGINLIFFAFKQYLIYGYFSGTCEVIRDGKPLKIPFDRVYGHLEYVYSRW